MRSNCEQVYTFILSSGDGNITLADFSTVMGAIGQELAEAQAAKNSTDAKFDVADTDMDGSLSKAEFLKILANEDTDRMYHCLIA